MSTIMDLTSLSSAGVCPELCGELKKANFQLKASKDEAVVVGSDGARVFRVTSDGVDTGLLKAVYEKNADLQRWVLECRTAARGHHKDFDASKEYDPTTALLAFRGENGKVRIRVEKRHEHEKHAAYTPFASVNRALFQVCCVAMEQFSGPKLDGKAIEFFQVAPQVRYDEKSKAHVATPAKETGKTWSDKIVYKDHEPKHKHHKHH